MNRIKIFFTCCALMISLATLAQQQVMFTQYMFNEMAINPAYAGSHDYLNATALIREQWAGLEGAPSTKTLSLDAPIQLKNIGLGLLLINDKIGVTSQTGIYTSYSYKLRVNKRSNLFFGLQGGLTFYNADYSEISNSDITFNSGDIRESHPNFGFGMYYQAPKYYIGLSAPQLLQTTFDKENIDSQSRMLRHYFISAGSLFDLSPTLKLKPGLLIKMVQGAPVEFDLNSNFIIKDLVWLGLSWRSFDSFDAIFQFQVTDQFRFGYAYDFATTTDLSKVQNGTHEFMLNYIFKFSKDKIITPRYF